MSNIHRFVGPKRFKGFFAFAALSLAVTASVALTPTAKPRQEPQPAQNDAALLEGYRHVEVASVSDALEQIAGRKCTCRIA